MSTLKIPQPEATRTNPDVDRPESSTIVGGNGWLAVKEGLKILKDMSPGPLAPLQMTLVGVLAVMDHFEVPMNPILETITKG